MEKLVEKLSYVGESTIEVFLKGNQSISHDDYAKMKVCKKNVLFCMIDRNNTNCLIYDYSGLINLEIYLANKSLSILEYSTLLLKLANSLKEISGVKLSKNNVILNPKYIYLDPETLDFYFIIIPCQEVQLNFIKGYQELFKNLFESTDFSQMSSSSVELLMIIKSNFELDSLIKVLEKLTVLKSKVINETFIVMAIVNTLFLMCGGLGYQFYFKNVISVFDIGYFLFLSLGVNVLGYIALKLLSIFKFNKLKKNQVLTINIQNNSEVKNVNKLQGLVVEESMTSSRATIDSSGLSSNSIANDMEGTTSLNSMQSHSVFETDTNSVSGYQPTGLLLQEKTAYLCKKENSNEKYKLSSIQTVIGREKGKVDFYIKENSVSKIHAIIKDREDSYFLVDQGSSNGTFINSKRLNNNMEYPLNNGDIIRFANQDYVFHQ